MANQMFNKCFMTQVQTLVRVCNAMPSKLPQQKGCCESICCKLFHWFRVTCISHSQWSIWFHAVVSVPREQIVFETTSTLHTNICVYAWIYNAYIIYIYMYIDLFIWLYICIYTPISLSLFICVFAYMKLDQTMEMIVRFCVYLWNLNQELVAVEPYRVVSGFLTHICTTVHPNAQSTMISIIKFHCCNAASIG